MGEEGGGGKGVPKGESQKVRGRREEGGGMRLRPPLLISSHHPASASSSSLLPLFPLDFYSFEINYYTFNLVLSSHFPLGMALGQKAWAWLFLLHAALSLSMTKQNRQDKTNITYISILLFLISCHASISSAFSPLSLSSCLLCMHA